jgi:hypothetical protein
MAGTRGPIPARSDQRVRRNLPDTPIDKITTIGPVEIPDLGIPNPHPIVKDLWESMKTSGQVKYYEPSDWQYARLTFHFVNKLLRQRAPSAMLLSSVNQMLTSLLLTEGDRRRVRIEVERQQNAGGAEVVKISDVYRDRLAAPAGT